MYCDCVRLCVWVGECVCVFAWGGVRVGGQVGVRELWGGYD